MQGAAQAGGGAAGAAVAGAVQQGGQPEEEESGRDPSVCDRLRNATLRTLRDVHRLMGDPAALGTKAPSFHRDKYYTALDKLAARELEKCKVWVGGTVYEGQPKCAAILQNVDDNTLPPVIQQLIASACRSRSVYLSCCLLPTLRNSGLVVCDLQGRTSGGEQHQKCGCAATISWDPHHVQPPPRELLPRCTDERQCAYGQVQGGHTGPLADVKRQRHGALQEEGCPRHSRAGLGLPLLRKILLIPCDAVCCCLLCAVCCCLYALQHSL